MSETNRYYYQRWIQILLVIVCLTVFSGFVYLSLTAAWGMSPARDIGICVFLFAWFACGLACLWGLNKLLGYVELNQDDIFECYYLFYKKRIKYSEIESTNITNSRNTRIPFNGLNKITDISKIFALLIASPEMVIGAFLQPMTVLIGLKGDKTRKFQFLQGIDVLVKDIDYRIMKFVSYDKYSITDEYQIDQKIFKATAIIALVCTLIFIIIYIAAILESSELDIRIVIISFVMPGFFIYGYFELLTLYNHHKNYKLIIKNNFLIFSKLKTLTRFFEPMSSLPHWFRLPLTEVRSITKEDFQYQIRRKFRHGFIIDSKFWQVRIYNLIPNSTQFIKKIKQMKSSKCMLNEDSYKKNNEQFTKSNKYKIKRGWLHYTWIYIFFWSILTILTIALYIVHYMPTINILGIVFILLPFLFTISKLIKLYKCSKVFALLEDEKLTFHVGGLKLFNFFIRDIGFTNQTVDLSDLVKVCYCTYPDSNISGLAERFTLKFKSKKDIQILNLFENGGDLFNRLIDICRYNYRRTSK